VPEGLVITRLLQARGIVGVLEALALKTSTELEATSITAAAGQVVAM
jgi:hypothetical protein